MYFYKYIYTYIYTMILGEDIIWKNKTEYAQNPALLLNKDANADLQTQSSLSQSTTSINDKKITWNLMSYLTVPKNGFPLSPAEEMNQHIWCINIVCRDAARYDCPIISFSIIGLPWSLLIRGRNVDQWIMMSNNNLGIYVYTFIYIFIHLNIYIQIYIHLYVFIYA
jgi:hypothetical protein